MSSTDTYTITMAHTRDADFVGCRGGQKIKFSGHSGKPLILIIGDNVRIEDDVKIAVGGTVVLGDNVTLHNHVTIHGKGDCTIGENSWVAQYTALDATGDLEIGKDCCIGFSCQIWSHVCRVPQVVNNLFPNRYAKTVLKDRVWLQGGLITINPGVTIGEDCVIFSQSVVNLDTTPGQVYGGAPAKRLYKYSLDTFHPDNG